LAEEVAAGLQTALGSSGVFAVTTTTSLDDRTVDVPQIRWTDGPSLTSTIDAAVHLLHAHQPAVDDTLVGVHGGGGSIEFRRVHSPLAMAIVVKRLADEQAVASDVRTLALITSRLDVDHPDRCPSREADEAALLLSVVDPELPLWKGLVDVLNDGRDRFDAALRALD
jgi:hypothetical protein